jgi:hypothetical protein
MQNPPANCKQGPVTKKECPKPYLQIGTKQEKIPSTRRLHYLAKLISKLPKKYFYFNEKSEEPPENLKTSRDSYLGLDLPIHINNSPIHLVIQSL